LHPDISYYIALTLLPTIGHVTAKHLISYCGGAKEIFTTSRKQLIKIPDVGPKTADIIAQQDDQIWRRVETELEFIEKKGIKPILFIESDYPQRLKGCHDSPILLYYKGSADLNPAHCLSIIGTRNSTDYGKEIVEQLVADLAQFDPNVCIVSGLAYGIDALAHKACLKKQLSTIGIVAHGLDRIYPPAHSELAHKMIQEKGGILSELMTETMPERENFPQRNRIVAGMTDATIVVQTSTKGGSLITVEYAQNYNRDVFAFPGRVNDPYSTGCNQLIKQQKATIATNAADIIDALNWTKSETNTRPKQTSQKQLFIELSETEKRVTTALKDGKPMHITELMAQTKLNPSTLAATLLELEFKNLLRTQPGSRYQLID
jgi:DNA processing protein